MWLAIAVSILITAVFMLFIFVFAQRIGKNKIKAKEELALKGIVAGINDRLHAAYPSSKWRWVCYPASFAANGGIARIEIIETHGYQRFIDICLTANGYMALHVINTVELTSLDTDSTLTNANSLVNTTEAPIVVSSPTGATTKPHDEESVTKWYNIVLIGTLTNLIDDLNAKGEVCVHINKGGKAYIEEDGSITVVYDFGIMPDVFLWGHVTDKLEDDGLFAEIQEDNCIFISWV